MLIDALFYFMYLIMSLAFLCMGDFEAAIAVLLFYIAFFKGKSI